jgi:hypothetical protein
VSSPSPFGSNDRYLSILSRRRYSMSHTQNMHHQLTSSLDLFLEISPCLLLLRYILQQISVCKSYARFTQWVSLLLSAFILPDCSLPMTNTSKQLTSICLIFIEDNVCSLRPTLPTPSHFILISWHWTFPLDFLVVTYRTMPLFFSASLFMYVVKLPVYHWNWIRYSSYHGSETQKGLLSLDGVLKPHRRTTVFERGSAHQTKLGLIERFWSPSSQASHVAPRGKSPTSHLPEKANSSSHNSPLTPNLTMRMSPPFSWHVRLLLEASPRGSSYPCQYSSFPHLQAE